jgi:hypothetical protein
MVFSASGRQRPTTCSGSPKRCGVKSKRGDIQLLVHKVRERPLTKIEQQTRAIIEGCKVEPKIERRIRVGDKGDHVAFGYDEPKSVFPSARVDADGMLFLEELKDWYYAKELIKVEGK